MKGRMKEQTSICERRFPHTVLPASALFQSPLQGPWSVKLYQASSFKPWGGWSRDGFGYARKQANLSVQRASSELGARPSRNCFG